MKKLFIADDNQDLLDLMHTIFHREYIVHCCSNAEKAFSEISEFEPDLVIVDNFLGDIDATTLIEKFRKKDSLLSTPFVLFSAHPSIKKIAAKLGAYGYIEKPFTVKDVKAFVSDAILKNSSDVHVPTPII